MATASGPYYLAEWYRAGLTIDDVDAAAADLQRAATVFTDVDAFVHVLSVIAAPTDDLLYALFAATDARLVTQACVYAGMPFDRLTTRIHARLFP